MFASSATGFGGLKPKFPFIGLILNLIFIDFADYFPLLSDRFDIVPFLENLKRGCLGFGQIGKSPLIDLFCFVSKSQQRLFLRRPISIFIK